MEKIKHTKNELKKQKDDLKRFTRYLPTLILKKQQLQLEIIRIYNAIESLESEIKSFNESMEAWVSVFGENIGLEKLIASKNINVTEGNIAGTDIPIFEKVIFEEKEYDYMKTALWVDCGIEAIKNLTTLKAKLQVLKKQLKLVREELLTTTQRVNLFEKIKIPEAQENIRKIRIFLGDMQTAAVVTGKIAKKKIKRKEKALI